MNRRTLKKHCQRAMKSLIESRIYGPAAFVIADGSETVDAPPGMERRYVRHGFLDPGPLNGTPLLYLKTSYEYDEWDYSLPSQMLREMEAWEKFESEVIGGLSHA